MSNETLPEPSEAQPDELNRMFGGAAVWAAPSPEIENRVVEALKAQGRTAGGQLAWEEDADREQSQVADLGERRAKRGGQRRLWPLAAAAAVLIAVAGAAVLVNLGSSDSSSIATVALAPTDSAPGASAVARIDERPNGAQLVVELSGLALEFWSGVSTRSYKTVTITLESEDEPTATGELILKGEISP